MQSTTAAPSTLPPASTRSLATKHLPPGAIRFDRAVVVDANGFAQPIASSTLFIPHGWHTKGGVQWGYEHLCTNGYNFKWSATSPDGLMRIAILPQTRWENNNYGAPSSSPGCQIAPYTNAQAYLVHLVERWHPGARVLDYQRRKDLEQQFAQYNSSTPMPLGRSRTHAESGEILFSFDDQGHEMRGSIAAVVIFATMRTNAGMGEMKALRFDSYIHAF